MNGHKATFYRSNSFLPNHGWTNLPNYNQYHIPHHEQNSYYFNRRHIKAPSTPILAKPASPLPGSEEYTQNRIQQTSDLIKRQLNIDNETCSVNESNFESDTISSVCTNNNSESNLQEDSADLESGHLCTDNRRTTRQLTKRNKNLEVIDVQEIHDKIIKHIASLSYSKKINLVNQSTSGYDIAIHEVQKQKRLELSRALRDISKRQTQNSDDGEVIYAIIPDIGIKIEDLPNDIIAELSNSLNLPLDEQIINNLVDPEECFKQAEEILNVNFEGDDHALKRFQHNLMSNNINQLEGSGILKSISGGNMASLNPTLKVKMEPEYQFMCGTNLQGDVSLHKSHATIQKETGSTCLDKSAPVDDNEKSDDDYSKDVEFNNFCFENFDLNKSYLVPHISPKPEPDIPKISNTNIVSDTTQKIKILKSETINSLSVNLTANTESRYEDMKIDIAENKVYCDDNPWENISDDKILDRTELYDKDIKSITNLDDEYITANKVNDEIDDLCISNLDLHILEPYTLPSSHPGIILNDFQESQIIQFPQSLEQCMQKRWKSPGEKKMMTDIRPKLSVIKTSNLTSIADCCNLENQADNVSLPQIESSDINGDNFTSNVIKQNTMEETISKCPEIKNENLTITSNQSIQAETELDKESVSIKIEEKELKISKPDKNVEENTELVKIQTPVLHQKQSGAELKLTNKSSKIESNPSEKNTKHKKTKSIESKNNPKPSNSDSIIQEALVINLPDENAVIDNIKNKNDNVSVYKTNKEHRKVKTAAEKKETIPISNSSNNAYTQTNFEKNTENATNTKITRNVYVQTTVDQKLKSENCKLAEKVASVPALKAVKHIFTQTIDNKTKAGNPKTTERKETQTVKNVKSIHIQTSLENYKPAPTEIKIKECKNVEVQVSSSVTSSYVQTKVNLENYNIELPSPNYYKYLLKLKEIDLEIEKLIETKKNLYKTIESEGNLSTVKNPQPILDLNKAQQEKDAHIDEKSVNVPARKHKKTDSDIELEEYLQNPKRKKRHRNSKKNLYTQINISNKPSTPEDTSKIHRINDEENQEEKRKPLSIKISLKNLLQSTPKLDLENILKKPLDDVTTKITSRRNSTEESQSHSGDYEIQQNISTDTVSRKRNSTERKCVIENASQVKKNPGNKPTNYRNEIKNNALEDQPVKRHIKVNKTKKIKANKQDLNLYSIKLSSENPQEKVLTKRCHVLIERCTIEYLQGLRKKIQEKDESLENLSNLSSENPTNIELVCDKVDLEFNGILGAVLDVKVRFKYL